MSFSCEKDKDEPETQFPPTDRGDVQIDSYLFMLTDVSTQELDTFRYGDFDTETALYDTIRWETFASSQKAYSAKIEFFFEGESVNSDIIANEQDYIVCYRGYSTYDLRITGLGKDSDNRTLGLESDWQAVNNNNSRGAGEIYITVNYQPQEKDGLCDPGVLIFEANVPYQITF